MSNEQMEIRYQWRELTEDGLLRKPKPLETQWASEDLNNFGNFETKEEAIEHMIKVKKKYEHLFDYADYVLIDIYYP